MQEINDSGGEVTSDPQVPNTCEFGSLYGDDSFFGARAKSGVLSFPQVETDDFLTSTIHTWHSYV